MGRQVRSDIAGGLARASVLLGVLSALAGCGEEAGDGAACFRHADCPACERCLSGVCVAAPDLLNACGACGPAPAERCGDGVDDDCDGATDEGCAAAGCGDGDVGPGETCDGDCPVTCADTDACTADTASGSAADCDLVCEHAPITECGPADGCCPPGCGGVADGDCGEGWQRAAPPDTPDGAPLAQLYDVWGSGPDDVWVAAALRAGDQASAAAALHWDGAAWTGSHVDPDLGAFELVSGSGPRDVWFVAGDRTIAHFDGSAWTRRDLDLPGHLAVRALHVVPGREGAAFLAYTRDSWTTGVARWQDGAWRDEPLPADLPIAVGLSGGGDDLWLVGMDCLAVRGAAAAAVPLMYDWEVQGEPCPEEGDWLTAAFGVAADDVWAVGDGPRAYHWDHGQWGAVACSEEQCWGANAGPADLWGAAAHDLWAVGDEGLVVHYDGTEWRRSPTGLAGLPALTGVWGAAPDDVWVVGGTDVVLRYR